MIAQELTGEEFTRYSRQMLLPEIGFEGQHKLRNARVCIIGAGGLGSPAALYLVAAGVGTIGLVDFDRVDRSNLHRQTLYSTSDIGRLKVEAAKDRLAAMNPNITIETHACRLDKNNAQAILSRYDLILDGSDNFETRYLVNDVAVALGKPVVFGSIYQFGGQVSVFGTQEGPCYRCLFPEIPPASEIPSCAIAGVLGVLPGMIGMLQATEAIKLITRIGVPLLGRILTYDALRMQFREIRLDKDTDCPVCSETAQAAREASYSFAENSFEE
ncbi:MAG TPA: molybdopterin-synthase adenylyltransferase MoeB [Candidatus Kapabacteria bacterium]|jgi:adenylyltransferase/sulfurtransferase|nr:molybdopterin-synthase adenylyltransferase MoeB [Candidatus Kapabacteria bacterium]